LSDSADTVLHLRYGNDDLLTSQEDVPSVWNNDNAAIWHLNNSSGEVIDSTTNNNDGTVFAFNMGELDRNATGQIGSAIDYSLVSFPDDPGYYLVGDNPALDITSEITISTWVNASDLSGGTRTIMAKGNGMTSINYSLSIDGGEAVLSFYNGGQHTYTTTGANITTGNWYHIAATYNDAANNVSVYVNGVERLNTTSNETMVANDGYLNVSVYSLPAFGYYGWEGRMDETRILNTARTQEWISTEFNNQSDPSTFYNFTPQTEPLTTLNQNGNNINLATDYNAEGSLLTGAGEFIFDGTQAQTINPGPKSITFNDIVITNNSTAGVDIEDPVLLTGNITIESGAVFDIGDKGITSTGGTFTNDGTLKLVGSQSISGLTMDSDSGTVEYYGGGVYAGLAAGSQYYDLHFTGGGTYTLTSDLTVNGDIKFSSANWYDAAWNDRIKIIVLDTGVEEEFDNFPVYIDLSMFGSSFFTDVESDGSDIVITSFDGVTKLNRELANINTTGETGELWFNADTINEGGNTVFYLYYNNPTAAETNSTNTWDNTFESVWHLHGAMDDATSNNHDFTDSGTAGNPGAIGDGRSFTGGAYLEDADAENYINGISGATLSLWVKVRADYIGNENGIVTTVMPDGDEIYGLGLRYDDQGDYSGGPNQIRGTVGVLGWSDKNQMKSESSDNVQSTDWTHIALTWAKGQEIKMYINGAKDATSYSTAGRTSTIFGATTLLVGKGSQDILVGEGWEGSIDEVHFSNVSRSDGWIQAEYDNQSSPSTFISTQDASINIYAGSYNINLAGDLDNSDNAGSVNGTFSINFINNLVVSNILGSNYFYDLMSNSPGKALVFDSTSLQIIDGELRLLGTSGNFVNLSSTSPGTQAQIDVRGTNTVSYVNVQDIYNVNATDIIATNSASSGNNTGWDFQ